MMGPFGVPPPMGMMGPPGMGMGMMGMGMGFNPNAIPGRFGRDMLGRGPWF
jgi:hypothetical protein